MTTLMKRRKRRNELNSIENQLLTPWNNSLLRPWSGGLFSSNLNNLTRLDDVFNDDFFEKNSLMPAMNVKENKTDFEIEFAIPGFDRKDFEISMEEDVLHVSGEKQLEKEKKEDDYSRKEFSYQSFKRSLMLPPSIDFNQDVKASYQNGILKIKLLKQQEAIDKQVPKKVIEVN